MTERKSYLNHEDALHSVSEAAKQFDGFIWGGYAIGLHISNLDYRPHEDIDVICPKECYRDLCDYVSLNLLKYPRHSCLYESHNFFVLDFAASYAKSRNVKLHLMPFLDSDENYFLPFGLRIPKRVSLSCTLVEKEKRFAVAGLEVLRKSKEFALRTTGNMIASKREGYQLDLDILNILIN